MTPPCFRPQQSGKNPDSGDSLVKSSLNLSENSPRSSAPFFISQTTIFTRISPPLFFRRLPSLLSTSTSFSAICFLHSSRLLPLFFFFPFSTQFSLFLAFCSVILPLLLFQQNNISPCCSACVECKLLGGKTQTLG